MTDQKIELRKQAEEKASHLPEAPMNLQYLLQTAKQLRQPSAPATFDEIYPFFQWLIVNIPTFVTISDGQLADTVPPEPSHGTGKQP